MKDINNRKICILGGGDARLPAAAAMFSDLGYDVSEDAYGAGCVILPVFLPCDLRLSLPELFSVLDEDGVIFAHSLPECPVSGRRVVVFGRDAGYSAGVSRLTAEGALCRFMCDTDGGVRGARVLIVGSGKLARALAEAFSALGADSLTLARRGGDLDLSSPVLGSLLVSDRFDAVFNTVPARVLDGLLAPLASASSLIYELASPPYGFDPDAAESYGMRAVSLPALPSFYAPRAAAELIVDVVRGVLEGTKC